MRKISRDVGTLSAVPHWYGDETLAGSLGMIQRSQIIICMLALIFVGRRNGADSPCQRFPAVDKHCGHMASKAKAAALKRGFVSEAEFERIVDPSKMVKPYVATAAS